MQFVDMSLGIQPQAMAILYTLKGLYPTITPKASVATSAWYNGRECGIVMTGQRTISDPDTKKIRLEQLNVSFGEVRNTDQLFVDVWITPSTINPPTVNDLTEEAYQNRRVFDSFNVVEAARYVYETFVSFIRVAIPAE